MSKVRDPKNDWSNVKFGIFCIFVIVVAFTLFGVVIYYTNENREKQGTRFSKVQTSTTELISQGCGSKSFMIRDGVCDQTTNNEVCLFDGGNCIYYC